MAKFIYARTATNDAICVNVERITSVSISSDDTLTIEFSKNDNGAGTIVLNLVGSATDAQEKTALLEVVNSIAGINAKVLTIKDDITGEGLSNIVTVGAIGH